MYSARRNYHSMKSTFALRILHWLWQLLRLSISHSSVIDPWLAWSACCWSAYVSSWGPRMFVNPTSSFFEAVQQLAPMLYKHNVEQGLHGRLLETPHAACSRWFTTRKRCLSYCFVTSCHALLPNGVPCTRFPKDGTLFWQIITQLRARRKQLRLYN